MRHEMRSILTAASIAPLAVIPAILCNVVWIVMYAKIVRDSSVAMPANFAAFLVTSLFGVPVAYALMLTVGVPAALGAWKLGLANLSVALFTGGLVGAATSVLLKGGDLELAPFLFMVWNGTAVAGTFYIMFKKRIVSPKEVVRGVA